MGFIGCNIGSLYIIGTMEKKMESTILYSSGFLLHDARLETQGFGVKEFRSGVPGSGTCRHPGFSTATRGTGKSGTGWTVSSVMLRVSKAFLRHRVRTHFPKVTLITAHDSHLDPKSQILNLISIYITLTLVLYDSCYYYY